MGMVRSWLGRVLVFDVLLTAAVAAFVVPIQRLASQHNPGFDPLDPLAYVLMSIALGGLLARRVWPVATVAVTVAAASLYVAAGYSYGPVFLVPAIAMYSLAARWSVRSSLAACAVAALVLLSGHIPEALRLGGGGGEVLDWVGSGLAWIGVWLVLPWGVGTVVRLGREDAMRVREDEAGRRAYEERLRVAREVHDVVGHGLAVINMQAGVALHVLAKRADRGHQGDQVQAALEAIKGASKDALDELRGTLAVFRRPGDVDGDGAPRRPAPGLGQLETLVADMADGGLPVRLAVTGERAGLPGAVDLAAYRIVQESLTNVLRHAGPASATVRVSYEPGSIAIEVTDDGAGRPGGHGGHGITGMRERAAAVGGTLDAGPRPGGGFRVRARLPAGKEPR